MLKLRHFVPLLLALPLLAQSNAGELRLKVTDPSGLGVKVDVVLVSEMNDYRNALGTDDSGSLVAKHLPFGMYRLEIQQPGFIAVSAPLEIRSAIPTQYSVQLTLASVTTSIDVQDSDTLIDPHRADSANQIGNETIQTRATSLPGRSLQDLVNSEPGWLYEGNAVLHPRGSEYQTQFVVDGIPLTDNRSPSFGPELEADDIQSMTVYTAGIPADYGRKMGGIVELNTFQDAQPGFHGKLALAGGSFDTANAFAKGQVTWGKNTLGASASGSTTERYLNPVVPQNYSNTGTLGDFSANYLRDFTARDRLGLTLRREFSRYDLPNEALQQAAGQRQTGDNVETMGIASWQHILSPQSLFDVRGMVRDNAVDF